MVSEVLTELHAYEVLYGYAYQCMAYADHPLITKIGIFYSRPAFLGRYNWKEVYAKMLVNYRETRKIEKICERSMNASARKKNVVGNATVLRVHC